MRSDGVTPTARAPPRRSVEQCADADDDRCDAPVEGDRFATRKIEWSSATNARVPQTPTSATAAAPMTEQLTLEIGGAHQCCAVRASAILSESLLHRLGAKGSKRQPGDRLAKTSP